MGITRRNCSVMVLAFFACVALQAQMHGAGGAQAPSGQASRAEQMGKTGPNPELERSESERGPEAEKNFVKKALEANVAEMQMAQLALQKSTDGQIRHFAMQMQDDHGSLQDELKQIAEQLNIPVPQDPSKNEQKNLDKLKELSGDAFDQAYVKEMVKAHKEAEKAYTDEAKNTTSPQLKEMMGKDAQMIEGHLKDIQEIATSKGSGKK